MNQPVNNLTNWIHRPTPLDPNLGSLAEMIAAIAGLAALGISVVALFIAWRSSKRSNFIRFQERLDEREVSEGRSIIYATKSVDEVATLFSARHEDSRWDRANRAVNLWNTLAQFTKLGLVDRKLSFDLWGDSVKDAWINLEHFIRFRRGRADFEEMPGRKDKWSSLVWFASSAGVKVHPDLLPGTGENPLG